jgi:hypothetical protein
VKEKTGGSSAVVDIETIDTTDPDDAAVVKLFDTYSVWALPVIFIDGKAACWGTIASDQIELAIVRALSLSGKSVG